MPENISGHPIPATTVLNNIFFFFFSIPLGRIFIDDVTLHEYEGRILHLNMAEYLPDNTESHFTE